MMGNKTAVAEKALEEMKVGLVQIEDQQEVTPTQPQVETTDSNVELRVMEVAEKPLAPIAIAPKEDSFTTLQRKCKALYQSGYFKDITSMAQVVVKAMAGEELGIGVFASMRGIHIVKGQPVISAAMISTLVCNHPKYSYRVVTERGKEEERCDLDFYESGECVGGVSFTMEEAKRAGLASKDNWRNYPSDMLFARAISRGARRYAPAIFGGAPIYTPEEVGEDGVTDIVEN